MALNFTGRDPDPARSAARPAGRTPAVIIGCLAAASVLAGLVVVMALHRHAVEAPSPAPPLVGTDSVQVEAPRPSAPAPAPAEAAVVRQAAAPPPAPAAAPPAEAPTRSAQAAARARMLAALRQVPHGSVTLSVEDDAGAQAYARQVSDLFREAGWTVDQAQAYGPGPRRHGLAAALGVSPADEAVREAFDSVGFRLGLPPPDAGIIRTPEIFVGAPD